MSPRAYHRDSIRQFLSSLLSAMNDIRTRRTQRSYTVAQAAKLFGRNPTWIYTQLRNGYLQAYVTNGLTKIEAKELDRFISDPYTGP